MESQYFIKNTATQFFEAEIQNRRHNRPFLGVFASYWYQKLFDTLRLVLLWWALLVLRIILGVLITISL